jgi:hypothetical protein
MRILRTQRQKDAGGWRRMNNEELYSLYFSSDIMKIK